MYLQRSVSVMNHTLIFVDESHHFSLTTAYCSRSHRQLNRSYCMLALSGVGWDHKDLVGFILHIYKKPCTIWLVKLHSFNKLSPYNVLNTVNNDLCSCFYWATFYFSCYRFCTKTVGTWKRSSITKLSLFYVLLRSQIFFTANL